MAVHRPVAWRVFSCSRVQRQTPIELLLVVCHASDKAFQKGRGIVQRQRLMETRMTLPGHLYRCRVAFRERAKKPPNADVRHA